MHENRAISSIEYVFGKANTQQETELKTEHAKRKKETPKCKQRKRNLRLVRRNSHKDTEEPGGSFHVESEN